MQIEFTRLTEKVHRLTIQRDDGSQESVELETRSLLLHDLVHLAVETEAHLERGFWGLVASGVPMSEVSFDHDSATNRDLATAESLVGPMQALWNGRLSEARYLEISGAIPPVDDRFVDRVRERLRALTGHWRATPFGHSMVVRWPVE